MTATPGEVPVYLDMNCGFVRETERRKRVRIQVHWPLRFHNGKSMEAPETLTRDLSSGGFYCLTKMPFVPGEFRTCTLGVPTNYPRSTERLLSVECKVQVVRVQAEADGLFGVGFRIDDYRFLDNPSHQSSTHFDKSCQRESTRT